MLVFKMSQRKQIFCTNISILAFSKVSVRENEIVGGGGGGGDRASNRSVEPKTRFI